MLPVAQTLSLDPEWGIRASVCSQLAQLAKGLSRNESNLLNKTTAAMLLTLLVQLSVDEEEAVRSVAVKSASSMLHLVDKGIILDHPRHL